MKVRHGHLYLADLNPRQGTEPGKTRPVVVIQTDYLNEVGHPSTWILPCTTQTVGESVLRVVLPKKLAGNTENCEVMIDQSRSIDNQRIQRELGKIPPLLLKEIKDKIRLLADL